MINKASLRLSAIAIVCALALPTTAQAARDCTAVTLPDGRIAMACKNVPDAPAAGPTGTPLPKPVPNNPWQPPESQTASPAAPTPATRPIAAATPAPAQQTSIDFGPIQKQAFSGIAQAAALDTLYPSAVGKTTVNAGAASFGGQAALGLTLAHRPTQSLVLSGGISTASGGKSLVRVGAGFEF